MTRSKVENCYVICVKSDNWKAPESFKVLANDSLGNLYGLCRTSVKEDCTYVTKHAFPREILKLCPDAPNATRRELYKLVRTVFWRGVPTHPRID